MQVMEGLIVSGIAMSYAEVSRPRQWSGALLLAHLGDALADGSLSTNDLHGIQVGVGTVPTLRMYGWLRNEKPSRERALKNAAAFDMAAWERDMRDWFGPTAETVIDIERKVGKHDPVKHAARLERIIAHWDDILRVMDEELPDYNKIVNLMKTLQEGADHAAYAGSERRRGHIGAQVLAGDSRQVHTQPPAVGSGAVGRILRQTAREPAVSAD